MEIFYKSPFGTFISGFTGDVLTSLRICNSETVGLENRATGPARDVFAWLDAYFAGKNPSVEDLNYKATGTVFQERVWNALIKIPYGHCVTYGLIARLIDPQTGKGGLFARAVGNAIARNPIWIIIPCHRVIRSNGATGSYGGGAEMKKALLKLENRDFEDSFPR